jgi:endonuclease/exonuclease/phosphatase family metal-dependent hydrolase
VLDRAERTLRRARRALSPTDLTARLLGLPIGPARRDAPGLLIVQIDGLSRERLLTAMRDGDAPFLRSLVDRGTHEVTSVYTGLPAMTPAVQAELFYGVRGAVASFSFVDHETGRVGRMYEADAVRAVEQRLRGPRALLDGGASYLNIYDAGAAHPRFCMASLGWGTLGTSHPMAGAAVTVLHLPGALRAAGAVLGETLRGAVDLARHLRGEDLGSEVKFAQSRVLISVVLRELCVFGASVDLARGTPIVHLNLLGYDEYAHRRGPDSAPARRGVRPVDAAVRRLARRAERSAHRHYDVWVMSDHGQERTRPYAQRNGRSVRAAVGEVFAGHGMNVAAHEEPEMGEQRFRARALGARVIELVVPGLELQEKHRSPGSVLVVAQGSLGNVYSPRPLAPDERDTIASALVARAAIPMVCAADGPGRARAWTAQGTFSLPDDTAAVVGHGHPYLAAVAGDLVELCHHPDAGDFVISGWHPTEGVSFSKENGAHAGPGPQETDAFVLAPVDTPLPPPTAGVRRFGDLRRAAFAVLDDATRPVPPRAGRPDTVRLLTYNVHGCVGMDEVLSLRRIARTIALHDPDVVALQELDVERARSGGVDQARELARLLQMELQFHPTITVAEEQFGDAVLSRLPMREVRSGLLPALGSEKLEPRGAIWVEVQAPSGRALQVVTTHLSLHPRERRMQIEALLGPEWLGDPRAARDVVLCGDFNAMAWFPSCRAITRRLRDAQIGVNDRRPAGTWAGRMPLVRIDHVFVDPALEIAHVAVADDVHARVASDHRPLVVDLVVP